MNAGGGPGREVPEGPPTQEDLEGARRFLTEAREELSRAEGKAAVLLAALGVATGALLAALMAGRWSPLELRPGAQVAWWLGAVCLVGAAVCLAAAVWPKTASSPSVARRPAFFGDFAAFSGADELAAALRTSDTHDALGRAADQILAVSKIVRRKYRLVRAAMILMGLAAALCLGAALADAALPTPEGRPCGRAAPAEARLA